jgi:hypothetical protein
MEYCLAWFYESNKGAAVKAIVKAAQQLGYTGIALSGHGAFPTIQRSRYGATLESVNPILPDTMSAR